MLDSVYKSTTAVKEDFISEDVPIIFRSAVRCSVPIVCIPPSDSMLFLYATIAKLRVIMCTSLNGSNVDAGPKARI